MEATEQAGSFIKHHSVLLCDKLGATDTGLGLNSGYYTDMMECTFVQ